MKHGALILYFLLLSQAFANEAAVTIALVEDSADALAGKAVISEAYERLGVSIEFRPFTAAGALAASNSGEVTAELQRIDGIEQKFENLVQVPIPINIIQGVAFSSKYRFPVTGWHSLRPYRIGIVKGIVFAEQQTTGMERQIFDSYAELIEALNDESIDVGVMPRVEGLETIRSMKNETILEMEGILETLFLYHYVHADYPNLVERLTPILKKMLLDGETRKFREQSLAAMLESE